MNAPLNDAHLEINTDVRFELRHNIFLKILKKSGWYVVSQKASHGPYESKSKAEEVFFYDRHYR